MMKTWLRIGIIAYVCLSVTTASYAAFTAQDVTGVVEKAEEAAPAWSSLAADQTVDQGYLVRTDFQATTALKGDDGSLLALEQATQVVIQEFQFDAAEEIRIVRLAIIEGTLTADAAHFEYPTNVFEIDTPTVAAAFKFSKATISVDKQGNAAIKTYDGVFDFWRENKPDGLVTLRYRFSDDIETAVEIPREARLSIETTEQGPLVANRGDVPFAITIGKTAIDLPANSAIAAKISRVRMVVQNISVEYAERIAARLAADATGAKGKIVEKVRTRAQIAARRLAEARRNPPAIRVGGRSVKNGKRTTISFSKSGSRSGY